MLLVESLFFMVKSLFVMVKSLCFMVKSPNFSNHQTQLTSPVLWRWTLFRHQPCSLSQKVVSFPTQEVRLFFASPINGLVNGKFDGWEIDHGFATVLNIIVSVCSCKSTHQEKVREKWTCRKMMYNKISWFTITFPIKDRGTPFSDKPKCYRKNPG